MENEKNKSSLGKKLLILAVIIALCILLAALFFGFKTGLIGGGNSAILGESIADQFGGKSFNDSEGTVIDAEYLKNADVTCINVWTIDCHYCITEMPDLAELADEYKDKGLQIVGVCMGTLMNDISGMSDEEMAQTRSEAVNIIKECKSDNYMQIFPSARFTEDVLLETVTAFPHTLFVDSEGKVIDQVVGSDSKDGWTKKFDQVLSNIKS